MDRPPLVNSSATRPPLVGAAPTRPPMVGAVNQPAAPAPAPVQAAPAAPATAGPTRPVGTEFKQNFAGTSSQLGTDLNQFKQPAVPKFDNPPVVDTRNGIEKGIYSDETANNLFKTYSKSYGPDIARQLVNHMQSGAKQAVEADPGTIAWQDKSKADMVADLVKSPIKDLIVTPGVRIAQVMAEAIKPGSAADKDVSIDIPLFGHYDVAAQKTGVAGAKQIAGQGLSAASWLIAPEKVVGVGRGILNDVALAGMKEGVATTDAMVRDALWNTIKKGAKEGAIIGSIQGLGSSLQEDKKWSDNARDFVIGGIFGGALGGALAGGGAGLRIAVNKTKYIQTELIKELVANGFTPEHANRLVSEGGYIGDILGSTSGEGPGATLPQDTLRKESEKQLGDIGQKSSYDANVAQPGAYVKERGFMTSLKEHPETAAIFKDVQENYVPHVNKDDVAAVRAMSIMEPEKFQQLVRSSDPGANSTIAKVMYLKDAIKAGNISEAKAMAKVLAPRGTELGQGVQAFRTLGADMGDPAKALVMAEKDIQSANKNINPKFEGKAKFVEKQFQKVHTEAADQVAKEVPKMQDKFADKKPTSLLEKKMAKQPVSVEQQLADQIRVFSKSRQPNPVKDMLNTLLKVAGEVLPAKSKKAPRNAIELIAEAGKNMETYAEVWAKAKPLVKERYGDSPRAEQAFELLEKYFNRNLDGELPVSKGMVGTAVKQGIKETGIDVAQLVRQHFTVVDKAGKDLATKLVEQSGLQGDSAKQLAKMVQDRWDELVTAKKQSIMKQVFPDSIFSKSQKSLSQSIIEWSNLGAFDSAQFRSKLAEKVGLVEMSDKVAQDIVKQAEAIQALPATEKYAKHVQTQNLLKIISDAAPMSYAEVTGKILNVPRALMSAGDLSFGLRQGIMTLYRHPIIFSKAFAQQFKNFASEKFYAEAMNRVMNHPLYEWARKAGIVFTDLGPKMGTREEQFMSDYAEKIPIVGKQIVRRSARAYTGFANQLRMDVFASLVKDADRLGLDASSNDVLAKDIAKVVNITTGRGSLGQHEMATQLLNSVFFSPRLFMSRLNMVNPSMYIGKNALEPFARKEALKSLFAFIGGTSTVLGLAKFAGLDVGLDARSSDFGKIKVGNTRFDIWGGFQQPMRMFWQLKTGQYISSTSGKLYNLGEGYKPMTRKDIFLRVLQSKENPIASFVTDWLQGTDYAGNDFSVSNAVVSRLTPMFLQDMRDIYKDDPSLLPAALISMLGVGTQTYAPTKPASKPFTVPKRSGGRAKIKL